MIGKTISHYRILERMGEGGMGVVYKAEDTDLGRYVALKFLPPHLTADADAVARFEREARAAAALNHPNIVTVHEIGRHDNQIFIAMECVEGRTLRSMVDERPLPLDQALDIAIQMGEALNKAHGEDVIHRDVKPANVLVDTDGRVRVVDFGLAKLRGAIQLTQDTSTLGTVRYMSPEQASGSDVDRRTDVWSLGVVLYEMVTGRRPFDGEFENAVVYAIVNEEPEAVTSLRTGVPMGLERVIGKALAKKPAERYHGVEDMLVDLRATRRELESGTSAPTPPASRRRNRLVVPVVAAVVAVIAVVAALRLLPGSVGEEPKDRRSIAVLPFHNLSPDPENEYFADGITEDITTQLSKIADLRVISRTSTLRFRNTEKPVGEIGEELNVATVLEGSVRRAGDRVRIVSQLIDTRTDEHLWAETYDRTLEDIFHIQSDVAQQIARALQATLTPEETARIETEPTQNLQAYETYLKGREHYNRYREEDNEIAVTLFKKAIEQDPGFAMAYAGLADAYGQRMSRFGYSVDWVDSSLAASDMAIALEPELAEGYKARGLAYMMTGRNRESVEANKRAIELNPNLAPAVVNLGYLYLFVGRLDEAVYWFIRDKLLTADPGGSSDAGLAGVYDQLLMDDLANEYHLRAIEKQPDNPYFHFWYAKFHLDRKRYAEVREQIAEIERIRTGPHYALWLKADLAVAEEDYRRAKEFIEQAIELIPRQSGEFIFYGHGFITYLGFLQMRLGDADGAERSLDEAAQIVGPRIESGSEVWDDYYTMACVNAIRGDKTQAIELLVQAVDLGMTGVLTLETDPVWENLRGDTRFEKQVDRVRQKTAEQRKRVEESDW